MSMNENEDTEMADPHSCSEQTSKSPASGTDNNNNNDNSNNNSNSNSRSHRKHSTRIAEKYGLRPRTIVRRLQLERHHESVHHRETKSSKIRPPPLSKYRRKTANARERHRMKEINEAFETLRRILPDFCSRRAASAMTKITTLKLAVRYIRALSHILQEGHPGDISFFHDIQLDGSARQSGTPLHHGIDDSYTMHNLQCLSSSSVTSTTSSSFISRGSLSSSGELSDLLSDDSSVFEDNLDAFADIPAFPEVDPFALLMTSDGEGGMSVTT